MLKIQQMVEKWRKLFYAKYADAGWIMATRCPGAPEYEGLRVPEIAEKMGVDEFTAAMELIRLTKNEASAVFFSMCEEDVETVMAHSRVMICTDSGVLCTVAVRASLKNKMQSLLQDSVCTPKRLALCIREVEKNFILKVIFPITSKRFLKSSRTARYNIR